MDNILFQGVGGFVLLGGELVDVTFNYLNVWVELMLVFAWR